MEEKNKIITDYINKKVTELENMNMLVPKENVDKLILAFINRPDDVNSLKTKIDTIFNNSVAAYKESIEQMGHSYKKIIDVYNKVIKMNKTGVDLYLSGGIVPYILLNEDSERLHANLDLLCSKSNINILRDLFRKKKLYDPKRDSLTYTVNNVDYGFQVIIDDVKVNFYVFEEKENGIIEYSFDAKKRVGRIKNINAKLNEYIVPYVSSDNKKYMTLSLEFVIANKLITNTEKDKKDIAKVQECNGISEEKIKKIPLPLIKEFKLVGDNLEYTSAIPKIKFDVPKSSNKGFINIGTILLLLAIIVSLILSH